MDKFLSDKRVSVFIGALLTALGGWGTTLGFKSWSEMFTPQAVFGLLIILGSVLGANVANNAFKTPPVITEETIPATIKTITTSTEVLK